MLVSCICIFFLLIFLVDALIFDKYIEHDVVSKGFKEIIWHSISQIFGSVQAQLEFLTLTGIIFNALM